MAVVVLLACGLALVPSVHGDAGEEAIEKGKQLYTEKKYDEAIVAFSRAVDSGDQRTAKGARAYVGLCHEQKGDMDQAIAWYERALEKDERYVWVLERLTFVCFTQRGTYARGLQAALRAEQLFSRTGWVFYYIARSHALEGRAPEAVRYLDKAVYFGFTSLARIASDADFDPVRDIEPFKRLVTHLDSVEKGKSLLDQAAQKKEAGAYKEADALQSRALKHYQDALGDNCLAGAGIWIGIAEATAATSSPWNAIDYYYFALASQIKYLGPYHPDIAATYYRTGTAYYAVQKHDGAIRELEKALAIRSKAGMQEDADQALIVGTLGVAYHSNGEYDRAIACHQKALAIWSSLFGEGHKEVATSCNNLGEAYREKGEYDRALEYYSRALSIGAKAFGADHPDLATYYGNMGLAWYSKGEYEVAIEHHQRALSLRLQALGGDHPDVAISYSDLGLAWYSKGEFERAIGYHLQALAIRLKALGAQHPDVATSYENLGVAYDSRGEHERALEYYQKALAIELRVLGADHPTLAGTFNNMGSAYHFAGDYGQALASYEKALTIWTKILGPEHPDLAVTFNNMGAACRSKGDYDRAIGYHRRALAIQEKMLGAGHPDVALTYSNLGLAHQDMEQYDRAIDEYQKSYAIAVGGANRELAIYAARNLGILQYILKQYSRARDSFQEGIAVVERARGETGAGKGEFAARNLGLYYLSLQASAAMNDKAGVFASAEAMRARGFLERLSLSTALSLEGIPEKTRIRMAALNDELESLAAQRAAEIQRREARQDTQRLIALANDIQSREKEFFELDQSLLANSRYRELRKPSLVSLQDAQQMIGVEEVIWTFPDFLDTANCRSLIEGTRFRGVPGVPPQL